MVKKTFVVSTIDCSRTGLLLSYVSYVKVTVSGRLIGTHLLAYTGWASFNTKKVQEHRNTQLMTDQDFSLLLHLITSISQSALHLSNADHVGHSTLSVPD